jgi:lantibiotic leader peptide-processing serine protease
VFLQPVVDALVYAGLVGIDVVNMSFYIDPWLYNCLDNPADSPEAQAEQRTVRVATQRAVNFARAHKVTPIAALGNQHTDLGNPTFDDTSPDFPPGAAYPRDVNNSCITVPTETRGVISISASGPAATRPTTPTTASSRPTSRPRAGGSGTTSGSRRTGSPRTRTCRPCRGPWPRRPSRTRPTSRSS